MKAQQKVHFHHKERVRWVDTDASQRIHFTAMFRYFETAEQEFFRSLGLNYTSLQDLGVDIPRVSAECNYTAPITYNEMLDIEVRIERVGNSSVTLDYAARREDGVVGANGRVTFCSVDRTTGRTIPLPQELRKALVVTT